MCGKWFRRGERPGTLEARLKNCRRGTRSCGEGEEGGIDEKSKTARENGVGKKV